MDNLNSPTDNSNSYDTSELPPERVKYNGTKLYYVNERGNTDYNKPVNLTLDKKDISFFNDTIISDNNVFVMVIIIIILLLAVIWGLGDGSISPSSATAVLFYLSCVLSAGGIVVAMFF